MDMTQDAISEIKVLAQAAAAIQIVSPESEPDDVYYMQKRGDLLPERYVAAPHPRHYVAESPADLALLVRRLDPDLNMTLIFVGAEMVVACTQESTTRRESVCMCLTPTAVFCELDCGSTAKGQADFIRMLRVSLNGAVPGSFISTCRSLKFSKTDNGSAKVEHGKESMGREVNRSVMTEDGAFPDEVILTLTAYEECVGPEWIFPVRCAVDIDIDTCCFTLTPLAGEMSAMRRSTHQKLARVLADELDGVVEVVCGSRE